MSDSRKRRQEAEIHQILRRTQIFGGHQPQRGRWKFHIFRVFLELTWTSKLKSCVSRHIQHQVRTKRTNVVHWCVCLRESNVKVAESAERFWHFIACLLWFQNKRKGSVPTVLLFLPDTDLNAAVRNAEHKNEYKHQDATSVDPVWMKRDTRSSYLKLYQGICLRLHYNHCSIFRRLMYNLKLQIQMEFDCFGLFISFSFSFFCCCRCCLKHSSSSSVWVKPTKVQKQVWKGSAKKKASQLEETVAEEERDAKK